jgi:hypothetical protein
MSQELKNIFQVLTATGEENKEPQKEFSPFKI